MSAPTSAPANAPVLGQTTAPVPESVPVAPPVLAPSPLGIPPVAFPKEDCSDAVRAADVDKNRLLDQNEFLQLVVILSGCKLISVLSEAQFEIYTELACECEKDPRFVEGCCSPDQRRVFLDDIDAASQKVCERTRTVITTGCAPSQTNAVDTSLPISPGVMPSVFSPASSPLTFPAIVPEASQPFSQSMEGIAPRTNAPFVLFSEARECRDFLDESGDRLTYERFLDFVKLLSGCSYNENDLPISLRAVFDGLSRNQDIDLVGRAVNQRLNFVNRRAEVCYEIIEGIGGTKCQEDQPPRVEPVIAIPQLELDRCANSIIQVDDDGNELLNKGEFRRFLGVYGQCPVEDLDFGHIVAFYNFACNCNDIEEICCFLDANVNVSGVALPPDQRSKDQVTQLSQVCDVAIGLTNRTCEAPPQIPDPALGDPECSTWIMEADANADKRLSLSEFHRFVQRSYPECTDTEQLPKYQGIIFVLLSCACLFERQGLDFLCCLPNVAAIDIDGVNVTVDERTSYQQSKIAVLCEVTKVAAEFGCPTNKTDQPANLPAVLPAGKTTSSATADFRHTAFGTIATAVLFILL
jgi:hypothetical protein